MPLILNATQALDSGDDLWILPLDLESPWYQRLNWLTNFSLTTNELHTRPKLHPWLIKILETCDIPTPDIPVADPILIPVSQWLPSEWLVLVPCTTNNESLFIQSISKIWKQLQEPSLRLFLPPTLSLKDWESLWKDLSLPSDVSLVFEPKEEELTFQ